MALFADADAAAQGEAVRMWSFGVSCREAARQKGDVRGVERRLSQVSSASSLDEAVHPIRGLVRIMRDAGVGVNYWRLARDFMLFDTPEARSRVLLRWSRDFYRKPKAVADGSS